MNPIDSLILKVAPERGLRRIKARTAAQALMNYDAASRGRRTQGWKAPAGSGDAAANGSRARLRQLSRDMIRNRPYAARAQAVVTGNVIGAGILPSVEMPVGVNDPDASTEALEFLKSHLMTRAIDAYGVHALPGLQTQVMNTVFADGEIIGRIRMRKRSFNPKLPLLFQVQLMECDHLDETLTHWGQNEVSEGVEYGPTGEAVAYHLYDRHPGDLRWWGSRSLTSSRVPAGQILHIRRADRAGQMRGVPWLAPVMMTLGEISDYQEAQILKQRMAALMAYFVESDEEVVGSGHRPRPIEELAPGAIVPLAAGQKVTPTEPPSVDGYGDFMRHAIWAIAMGVGITGESLSGDLRGVNFSSGRMGRMEMDRFVEVWQKQLIIDQFLTGIGEVALDTWRIQAATGQGFVGRPLPAVPARIGWTAPRRPLIDPAKEIKAAQQEVDAGFVSRQRKQRELGHDPDTIARERAEDAVRDRTAAPAGQIGNNEELSA